jgi:O-acetyl-ADP-ribose deacetylase (regulator of RNase III)
MSTVEAYDDEMLIYHRTSIMHSGAQTVVNTVNCVGVMGKGLAAALKARHPTMFDAYKAICDRGALTPGKLWLWKGLDQWVLNFPTKNHWRGPSRLEWVESGLEKFVAEYANRGITEISFPRLGCGNGGLDWDDVKPLMEKYLSNLTIPVYVHDFEYDLGMPEHLEDISRRITASLDSTRSFEGFVSAIRQVLEAARGEMVTLAGDQQFKAFLVDDEELIIKSISGSFSVPVDELRGVWIALMNGVVTKDRVLWAAGDDADYMLAILSLLPDVRAIQVQKRRSERAEIAVELKPRRTLFGINAASPPQLPAS